MDETVWVVEQGEYSDYRVVGVFSSEAHARLIADALNAPAAERYFGNEATVSEWPLDPAVHALRTGYVRFFVQLQADGTVNRCEKQGVFSASIADEAYVGRRSIAPGQDVLNAAVWAKDEEHAVKIANEHRTRLIASGEWAVN